MASASVLVCRCVPPSGMDRSLSEVVASPRRGRPSSLGGAAVETPPKTPATSHCRCVTGTLESAHALSLPYSVCDAVAKAIWSHAKAHAEGKGDTVLPANIGLASSDCSGHDRSGSPSAKRRRSTCNDLAVPDHLKAIFARCGPTQPSQTQDDQTNASSSSDDTLVHARGVLDLALVQAGVDTAVAAEILARVRAMALSASAYWREVSVDLSKAASSLYRYLEHQRLLYWRHQPWRGVNLGGWLLLEPGPSYPLFEEHPLPDAEGEEARCEWGLMEVLHSTKGAEGAAEVMRRHRERHITKNDFQRIRACGMNAVRLPFGSWVVMGPREGEPYIGSGIEFIDRAVDWAEEVGLQIVLDLHGCPGGESGEAPCGRRQRPHGTWQWQQWDFQASLKILEVVAQRYCDRSCVTGIAVCNEPSNEVPLTRLCQYYDQAITLIRSCGLPASRVAAVLPVFQRPEDKFARKWQAMTGDRHQNFCFDIHCYHCFENEFNGKSLAQQLRAVEDNAPFFKKYPIVVGEWSLSLGVATWSTCGERDEDEVHTLFGRAQAKVLKETTHGNFFWNWTERPDSVDWNYQVAYDRGMLCGPAPSLPLWDGRGEDPLEQQFNPCEGEQRVLFGDKVCLRVFYGRYVDVYGSFVNAQWVEKGSWQQFVVCPVESRKGPRQEVRSGDVVQLRAHNGRFLAAAPASGGREVSAQKGSSSSSSFVVHVLHSEVMKHLSVVYLECKATRTVVDADDEADGLFARYRDRGLWQQLVVEKVPSRRRPSEGKLGEKCGRGEDNAPPTPKNRAAAAPPPSAKRARLTSKSISLLSLSTAAESIGRSSSILSMLTSVASSSESGFQQRLAVASTA
mmetsp:Transcript_133663/g.427208  ORF Transcript_133663/g.427208 Transcript_133663/m.427208 type:complete len:850 (-) Transcript_133663:216-2765(-)